MVEMKSCKVTFDLGYQFKYIKKYLKKLKKKITFSLDGLD